MEEYVLLPQIEGEEQLVSLNYSLPQHTFKI